MGHSSIPIFIDGAAGTTGLLIESLIRDFHPVFQVLSLPEDDRKDPRAKREIMGRAKCAVLCLPDAAAKDSAAFAADLGLRVLDASSAHRVSDAWTYGLPELNQGRQRALIGSAQLVANPGCYATAALLILNPLVAAGLIRSDSHLTVFGISGYSGGGRAMIQRFGNGATALRHGMYSLEHEHKHSREIVRYAPLRRPPHFLPSVGPFERGMAVTIPIAAEAFLMKADRHSLSACLEAAYRGEPFVQVAQSSPEPYELLTIGEVVGTNTAKLYVFQEPGGNSTFICHLDNLGKGASFAAVQNLNIMFGLEEGLGLDRLQSAQVVP